MVRSIPYYVEGTFGVRRIDGEPAGAEHWGTYGGGGWLLSSERSRPTPLDLRRVSFIKPTPDLAVSAAMSVSNVWDS